MSLIGTIYSGTTGLTTFSKGLDTISNNVTNMNTPGYKRNEMLFRDLFYEYSPGGSGQESNYRKDGYGVTDQGTTTNFSQGDVQSSGNETDVAIRGNGLFILHGEGEYLYSRIGQFQINSDGLLVNAGDQLPVAGIDSEGKLTEISIGELRTSPASPTRRVSFTNNLSTGSSEHEIANFVAYDSLGEGHDLKITFSNNSSETPRSWLLDIEDNSGNVVAEGLEIRFQGNGSPEEGYNSVTFTFQPEGADASEIELYFGEPGSFSSATSFSAGSSSDLVIEDQDGKPHGSIASLNFSDTGLLEISYSNGETAEAGQLAMAWLSDVQSLQQAGGGQFRLSQDSRVVIGKAMDGVMGEIVAGSIEMSNVELSQEFTDLVIVQRGFQVSSQVVSIANEMVQQLLDSSGSKR